jgi:hypothetical protein
MSRFVKGGAVGLAVLASARWLWQSSRPAEFQDTPADDGESR